MRSAVKYNQIALKIQTKKVPMSAISNGSVSMRIRIIVARPNRILGLNKPYYVRLKTNPPGRSSVPDSAAAAA